MDLEVVFNDRIQNLRDQLGFRYYFQNPVDKEKFLDALIAEMIPILKLAPEGNDLLITLLYVGYRGPPNIGTDNLQAAKAFIRYNLPAIVS